MHTDTQFAILQCDCLRQKDADSPICHTLQISALNQRDKGLYLPTKDLETNAKLLGERRKVGCVSRSEFLLLLLLQTCTIVAREGVLIPVLMTQLSLQPVSYQVLVIFFGDQTFNWQFRETLLPYEEHKEAKKGECGRHGLIERNSFPVKLLLFLTRSFNHPITTAMNSAAELETLFHARALTCTAHYNKAFQVRK